MSASVATLRPMCGHDLEQVFLLRNHVDIRGVMLNKDLISFEEHFNWFKTRSMEKDRLLIVYESNNVIYGFANVYPVLNENGVFEWGFYLDPNAPKNIRSVFGQKLLDYIFSSENILVVCGNVLNNNFKSIRFHQRLGFEGYDSNVGVDSQYSDMKKFFLRKDKWLKIRSKELS